MKDHLKKYCLAYSNAFIFAFNVGCMILGPWPAFNAFFAGVSLAVACADLIQIRVYDAYLRALDAQKQYISILELRAKMFNYPAGVTAQQILDREQNNHQWKH